MLVPVIGGVIVALAVALPVWAHYRASLTVPPRDLVRRWRAETRSPRRP
jgi:hypothetical protein